MIIKTFDPVIGDSHPKYIAGKVSETVLSLPDSLAIDYPNMFPNRSRYLIHKTGLFHGIPEFSLEYDGQGFCMHKKVLP